MKTNEQLRTMGYFKGLNNLNKNECKLINENVTKKLDPVKLKEVNAMVS